MRKFWHHIDQHYPTKAKLFWKWLSVKGWPVWIYKLLPIHYQFGLFIEFVSACEYDNQFHELPNKLSVALKMEFEVNSGHEPFNKSVHQQIENWFSMSSYIDKELSKTPDFVKLQSTDLNQVMEIYTP